MPPPGPLILHATAVAVGDRGLLIRGTSGSGKSSLALEMMALDAALVADDRVELRRAQDRILMRAPDPIAGLIEARGLGILHAPTRQDVPLCAVLDLDTTEKARLPPQRGIAMIGVTVPLLQKVDSRSFPAALVQYLKAGRKEDDA